MWFPYNLPQWIPFNTTLAIDNLSQTVYKLPSTVMETAVRPINANDSLDFDLDTGDATLVLEVYLHFAELEFLPQNQHREFNIDVNGNIGNKSVVPIYLSSTTELVRVRGPKLNFSIHKTPKSTLPPILNAMEVYIVKDFLYEPTDQEEGMLFLC